jgi:hypothetical protein
MDESQAGGVSRAALPGISGTACIMLVSKVSFLTERASLRSLAGPVEGQQPTARNRFPTTYRRGSKKTSRPQAGRCGDSIRESRCIRLVTEAGCGGHGGRLASKAVRKYLAVRPVEASPRRPALAATYPAAIGQRDRFEELASLMLGRGRERRRGMEVKRDPLGRRHRAVRRDGISSGIAVAPQNVALLTRPRRAFALAAVQRNNHLTLLQ